LGLVAEQTRPMDLLLKDFESYKEVCDFFHVTLRDTTEDDNFVFTCYKNKYCIESVPGVDHSYILSVPKLIEIDMEEEFDKFIIFKRILICEDYHTICSAHNM
jgi:hypothetical protein